MPIFIIGALLIVYGIFAIYSVSIYESFNLTIKFAHSGIVDEPSNYFYFTRQITNLLIAIVASGIIYFIPIKFIQKHKNKIFIMALILQLLVFTGLGIKLQGAKGWLYIEGVGTLQPSEFFKLAFILFMSGWFLKKKNILGTVQGFIGFIIVIGLFFLVFLKIPDLGTLLVLGPVVMIMYRYVGGRSRYIFLLTVTGITIGSLIGMQFEYIQRRFDYFINPDVDESGKGVGWQIQQGLIAIGGGGIIGKGYGKGLQKFGYIPEAQSDFIFSAYSEEVGLIGNSILLTLYFLLCFFVLSRLGKIEDEYNRILGVGIISLIMIQVFVNIGGNIKLLPLTGLTLPFISYGGTALLINLIEIVLLQKILYEK